MPAITPQKPLVNEHRNHDGYERPVRILLTGFEPFRQYKENPSWMAVSKLTGKTLTSPPSPLASSEHSRPIEIHTLKVPVTYTAVSSLIPPLHSASPPFDAVVHVGVGLPGAVKLERLAHKEGYDKLDAENQLAPEVCHGVRGFGGEAFEDFALEERSSVDIDGLLAYMKEELAVEHLKFSEDPGRYLCDFIYYTSLTSARKANPKRPIPVLFIHVPPLGGGAAQSPYDVPELARIIEAAVRWVGRKEVVKTAGWANGGDAVS